MAKGSDRDLVFNAVWNTIQNREDAGEFLTLWRNSLRELVQSSKAYKAIRVNTQNAEGDRIAANNYRIHRIRPQLRNLNDLRLYVREQNAKRLSLIAA
jgi:hypothetical protein